MNSKDRKARATIERRIDYLAKRIAENEKGEKEYDKRELWALQYLLKKI